MAAGRQELFITTQPGWAFATLAELRSLGVVAYASFYHRDSSIVLPENDTLRSHRLATPDNVYAGLAKAEATKRQDATEALRNQLQSSAFKGQLAPLLEPVGGAGQSRYSITTEVHGNTVVHRRQLSDLIENGLANALPRWRRTGASEGVRLFCKADPQIAILGLQRYSNLPGDDSERAGSLRGHLARGLLTIADVQKGDVVFDPFAGTGTVLKMARDLYHADACIGLEVDAEAYRIAKRRLDDPSVSLVNSSFEEFNVSRLPAGTKLVSNVPFGMRFARVPTKKLVRFMRRPALRGAPVALLMSREQADEMVRPLRAKRRNVLVLGQPASILYRGANTGD